MHAKELQIFYVSSGGNITMGKATLYFDTIKYMKLSQIYYRITKKIGLKCTIGCTPNARYKEVAPIKIPLEFDYDHVFLKRFDANEFLNDKVTFLHSSKEFSWDEKWEFDDKSMLWNFNLHYFEYLLSLVYAYDHTGNKEYLNKTIYCIEMWIKNNPIGEGIGWSPYTIDLRLTNWISYYCIVENELPKEFKSKIIKSIYNQFEYLSKHIEKDILGNHYFEDLKTLVLCSMFFNDKIMLEASLKAFKTECKEEILSDGMHFELSPMYHKIIFEGLLRVIVALRGNGIKEIELENLIQPMLDVAWSFEEGLDRIPLFNDCGNNIAKSLDSFVKICKKEFGITPRFKSCFVDSGFYIYKWKNWKMIVDAGQVGPSYIPGHAHCDAMSFELFKDGKPVITNCGTYGYQCKERQFFRSTAAHNTVMVDGIEQSQCWGSFRVAKRCSVRVLLQNERAISMELIDYDKNVINREIKIETSKIIITDSSKNKMLKTYLHIISNEVDIDCGTETLKDVQNYAPEYGLISSVDSYCWKKKNEIKTTVYIGD